MRLDLLSGDQYRGSHPKSSRATDDRDRFGIDAERKREEKFGRESDAANDKIDRIKVRIRAGYGKGATVKLSSDILPKRVWTIESVDLEMGHLKLVDDRGRVNNRINIESEDVVLVEAAPLSTSPDTGLTKG